MDFTWQESQIEHRRRVVSFAQSELNAGLRERARRGGFNRSGWQRCAEMGILGLPVPRRYGGEDCDPLTAAFVLAGLGYGCMDNGLIFAIGAHLWGCTAPILAFGDDGQKRRWLPALAGGAIGALAVSEAEAGSDIARLHTTAVRDGDSYVLNGRKLFVTNAPVADLLLVLASMDPALGSYGLAAFLVESTAVGVAIGDPVEKMGLHTALMGEITLDHCRVPAANLLGREGSGLAVFNHAMLWERGLILASALGAMQRLLEKCTTYAQERQQFGQAIGKFQLVASRLVDMRLRLETAQLLLYKTAWLLGEERAGQDTVSLAKLAISEAWIATCEDAMQIFGGYSYLADTGIEAELRDAMASRFYSGTAEIQRQIVARWMGVG